MRITRVELSVTYNTKLESGREMYASMHLNKDRTTNIYMGSSSTPDGGAGAFIIKNADEIDEIGKFVKEAKADFDRRVKLMR